MSDIESFIHRWASREGGQERANYSLFLIELCELIGVERPQPAGTTTELNAYVFERAVTFHEPDGSTSKGRIDLYKRGSFILEAKQSKKRQTAVDPVQQAALFSKNADDRASAPRWDALMKKARRQAEDYAKALPVSEGWPPFLVICDVGHCLELYSDFSGQGKHYAQFPDRKGFRIFIEDLRKPEIRERLRQVWEQPHSLDPAKRSAKVTREIAARLAKVSKHLEDMRDVKSGKPLHDPEQIALFLMRCLFTMFAEDVGLLPKESFKGVLERCIQTPEKLQHLVGQLWAAMDKGEFAYAIEAKVKRFNGYLFKDPKVLPLPKEEIGELLEAAKADWREVEPAIFGALLEQALDPKERKRLGAHYTPRVYVERLVAATVIEPLRLQWDAVQAAAEKAKAGGDSEAAIAEVLRFHGELCSLRILDPACGTGNFLYIALEMMKRLEGEVLEAVNDLGGQEALGLDRHSIDPHQFLGLELNPRAKAIAELVIWIGYLQWYFRTQTGDISEPILKDFRTVKEADAVLAYDKCELRRDETGRPVTGTGADGNKIETYLYRNPKIPAWPEADYIVGNPPFIGGKDLRARLGDDYTETLWKAHSDINESADFVMYWWDHAAGLLTRKGTKLRRFGFVTTNSITQEFSRRVMTRHLKAKKPISFVMAIPDHPWTKATRDAASVRIAMTVVEAGAREGVLSEVTLEADLDTDTPEIALRETKGTINPDLTIGADVTTAMALKANEYICSPGVKLHGAGFIVTTQEAAALGLGKRPGLEKHIRHYRNGRDLTGISRNVMVIDLFGLDVDKVKTQFPEVYQHVMGSVKVDRQRQYNRSPTKDAQTYLELWWVFGKPRQELRRALFQLPRFIATVETAKHRTFQFLDASILPDNMLVCMCQNDAWYLGVLSSQIHLKWTAANAASLGVYKGDVRYTKSRCFDPFPFPDPPEALKAKIRAVAEELDALRKSRQAEHPRLTITQMYNVLEKLRAGETLDATEETIRDEGLVLILKELHDTLDAYVFEAYGWPQTLSDEEILSRLVALNKERAAEEAQGHIRWLRPDFQKSRAGIVDVAKPGQQAAMGLVVQAAKEQKPLFPAGEVERFVVVMSALANATALLTAKDLAGRFRNGRTAAPAIAETLAALERLGQAEYRDGAYFLRRRAA